jgi:uncharacterized protein (UPF0212 family)
MIPLPPAGEGGRGQSPRSGEALSLSGAVADAALVAGATKQKQRFNAEGAEDAQRYAMALTQLIRFASSARPLRPLR